MRGSRAKSALLAASLAVISSVHSRTASGASLTWNKNTTGSPADGAGAWNTTSANWYNGTSDAAWNSANTALFGVGGAGGTVTIASGGITAAGLTFNTVTTAYNISGSATAVLTLSSPTIQDSTASTYTSIISAPIAGTAGLNINFSAGATLDLSGTSTFTGGTTINGGLVNFFSDASFGAAPGTAGTNITLTNGAAIEYATANGTTTLNANRGIAVGNGSGGAINCFSGRTLTYGGVISNVAGQIGNFSANSVGLLILTGNSTYSGTTTITAGTIRVGTTNALPTTTTLGFNDTTYPAGTLDLYGNNQTVAGLADTSTNTRFITNSNTGTSTLTVAGPGTFGGVIENSGGTKLLALTKSGSGTLTLNGVNTYSGTTSITGGTLALGSGGSISNSSTINVGAGATFDVSANSSYAVGSAQTLTGNGNVNGSFSFGAGTINPGTVGTAGTLTFNSGLTLAGGGLSFDLAAGSNTSGGGINDLISVTGALSLNAVTPVSVSFSGTPAVGTTYTVLTSGSESGSGSFLAQQHGYTISNSTPGVVTVTYVGGPAIANQVWSSTSSSSWDVNTSPNWFNTDSSTTDTFFNGDNVTFNDSVSGVQTSVTLTSALAPGSVTVNSSVNNYTFTSLNSSTGKITGTTGLTKSGSSTLTMSTALNDYTGVTNISGGILNVSSLAAVNTASSIGKGSAGGSASDLVFNGGTLQYTGSTSQTTNRLFTLGTAGGTIDGSGTSGAVLDFSGTGAIAFAGSGPRTLTLTGSGGTGNAVTTANTFAPVIGDGTNGSTGVVVSGTGWWALTGVNTFTGGVNVSGATLVYAADSNFGAVPASPTPNSIILNGGILNQSLTGTVTLNTNRGIGLGNSGGTIQTFSGKTLVYGGVIADAPGSSGGPLVKDSVGTLILSGSSTYSGNTNMLAGTIQLGASNALPATTTLSFVNPTFGAYFDLNGFNQTIGGLSDTSSAAAHYVTNSNTGTSTLTVSGSGTYNGVLQDGGSGKLLALTKSGVGTLTLGGSNNYSGPTYITGGTLALSGGGAIATSPLISVGTGALLDISAASSPSLGSSQTLIGNGSINGSLSFNGGTINPGTVGTAGTLTFNNDLNANGGLIKLDLSGASNVSGGGINDLISITGNFAVNAVTPISVSFTGSPARGTEYWVITSGSESGSLSNLIPYQSGYTVDTSVPDEVGIIYTGATGANNLVWNSTSSSNWDIGFSHNWFNQGTSTNDVFFAGDNVTFNDSSGVQTSINLTTALAPGSMQVSSNTNNYTFSGSGKITGATGLVKSGTSTLTMNTTLNDYTGVTLISGGVLNVAGLANVNQPSSIGAGSANGSSGDLVLNGGTLQYTGSTSQTTNRLLSIGTAGGTIDNSGSAALTFNGTGAIGFNGQTGPRTLTLTGSNTTSSVFAPVIGDNGAPTSVLKSGAGTWALSGSNTFTGPVTVTGGTLTMNTSDLNLGAVPATPTPGAIVLNGGGLADNIAGTAVLSSNRGIELGTAGGGIYPFFGKTLSYGGVISDLPGNTGALIKDSLGTLILSGNSTYSGSTTINSGTIQLNVSNALPTTTTLAFNDLIYSGPNSTLNLAGFSQTVSALSDDSVYTAKITSTAPGVAVLTVNGGGNFYGVISDGGSGDQVAVTKSGSGALTFSGSNTYSGGTTVTSGVLVGTSGLAAVGSGTVTINGGGLIFQNTSASVVFSLLQSGYNGGKWNGAGINSSAASGDSSSLHALGMDQPSSNTTFEGQPLGTGDVAVKYTYYGDANLDGKVDGSDYSMIDNGYLSQLTGWQNGDFNYDGVINGSDYTLIDNAYNTQGALIAAAIATPTAQIAGTSAVPEPASLGLLALGTACLLGRRRRRN